MSPSDGVGQPLVLVVDDNEGARKALGGLVRGEGYRVLSAEDGPEALRLAADEPPDAVLLDVMMPRMDGFEVCRRMREDPSLAEVPVIMVTALDDRATKMKALETRADEFLTKPVDRAELRARLRTIMELNRYRKLSAERRRVERLLKLAPDGIAVVDAHGQVLLANSALESLVEVPRGEASGRILWSFVAPEDLEAAVDFHARVLQGGPDGAWTADLRLAVDGEVVPVEVSAAPFPWNEQPTAQWVVRDVRARKELEERLSRTQRFESIAQLTGSIAHDFNNYLTAIVAPVDLLLHTESFRDEVREDLEEVRSAGRRAARLCRRLLEFSKRKGGKPRLVDVDALLRDMEPLLRKMVVGRTEVVLELAAGSGRVWMDPTRLEQVVANLVVNAAQAMDGRGTVRVGTELDPGGSEGAGRLHLTVVDAGVGMDEETRASAFEPFFSTKGDDGTGLGLSTVQGIVADAGGVVEIESDVGLGTTFHVRLPVADASRSAEAVARLEGTVLFVDPRDAHRMAGTRRLERHGLRVLGAESGTEAVHRAREAGWEVDLLLARESLPDMSGLALLGTLRNARPALPGLLSGERSDVSEAWASDDVARLPFPYTFADLVEAVAAALRRGGDPHERPAAR